MAKHNSEEINSEENDSDLDKVKLDSVVDSSFSSLRREGVEVSELVNDLFQNKKSFESVDDHIKRLNAEASRGLALGLWSAIFAAAIWHTFMIGTIALDALGIIDKASRIIGEFIGGSGDKSERPIEEENDDSPDWTAHDKASALVGDTAKTLYAVLTPLATSVTGFYFVSKSNESDLNDDSDNSDDKD